MSRSDFIDDGYNEPGYVAPHKDGLHGELHFVYRPMLPAEQSDHGSIYETAGETPSNGDRKWAAVLADKLVSWSLTDAKGGVVPISAGNLLKLRPALFHRLWPIVLGTRASDKGPQAPAAPEKQSVGADQKNWPGD
jgi:hypothetical protein